MLCGNAKTLRGLFYDIIPQENFIFINSNVKRKLIMFGRKPYLETHSHIGETYGRLTIKEEWSNKSNVYFRCECSCGSGKEVIKRKNQVIQKTEHDKKNNSPVPSCGCVINRNYGRHDARGYLLAAARYRATERGMQFTITKEDIVIPDKCPLLGIDIIPKAKDRRHSPSLDRIDSTKGYTPDNVWVVSSRANTLKNDASLQELQTLVENLQKL